MEGWLAGGGPGRGVCGARGWSDIGGGEDEPSRGESRKGDRGTSRKKPAASGERDDGQGGTGDGLEGGKTENMDVERRTSKAQVSGWMIDDGVGSDHKSMGVS